MTAAGPMPWPRLSRLLSQLVQATHMLHRRKGLLCGVSPDIMRVTTDEEGERLLISSAGVWQAQDLLATLKDDTLRGIALADAELRYTAPELMTGRNADVRSDVFTMGVLAYEMATAALPYDGASSAAVGNAVGWHLLLRGHCSRQCASPVPRLPEHHARRRTIGLIPARNRGGAALTTVIAPPPAPSRERRHRAGRHRD